MEKSLNRLKIKKLIDSREKQQILAIRSILENHTQQKDKIQA